MRVRFAPSPTGALHIGGIRTALFNYLLAKKHGGTFILRIEDTDQNRFVEGAEQYIIDALKWCGIAPTEGIGFGDGEYAPYRQSERKALYRQYAAQLIASGNAYYAFDTPDELESARKADANWNYSIATRQNMRNSFTLSPDEVQQLLAQNVPHVVRFKMEDGETVTATDIIRGEVTFRTNELDDKVLMKADGMPTYHLANIVDDYLMRITHVIRGEEWLPSVGHHVLLYRALGWAAAMPQFAHLPLILRPDGKGKLSKRDGAKFGMPVFPLSWLAPDAENSFEGFREVGFDPRAVVNFLALLGWSSGDDQEIFSLDELTERFSLERINKAGARFDFDKAKWFNQQYLQHSDNASLAVQLSPLVKAKGYAVTEEYLEKFVGLMKERVTFLGDFLEKGDYCFAPIQHFDQANIQKRWKAEVKEKFVHLTQFIATLPFENAHDDEHAVKEWLTTQGYKMGELLPLLRLALAGTMQGPAIFDLAQLLGKSATMERLNAASVIFDGFIS